MRPSKIHVPELDGLRGLLALWVVLGHWSATVAPPGLPFDPRLHNGAAVGLFMLLSGFVIAALIEQRPERWHHYIARRALRLFPAYLPVLLVAILMAALVPDIWAMTPDTPIRAARLTIAEHTLAQLPAHVMAHAGLLQGLIPPALLPSTDFALIGQAWSLSLEWQFYLVAPVFVAALQPMQKLSARLIGVSIALSLGAIALLVDMPAGFLGRHLPEFGGGIASWLFYRRLVRAGSPTRCAPLGATIALILLLIWRGAALAPAIWIATLCALLDPRTALVGRWLRHPALLWLGACSYPVYLTHMLAMMAAILLLGPLGFEFPGLLLMATLGFTLAVSTALHRLVERPAMDYARRLFRAAALEPVGGERGRRAAPLQPE